MAPSSYKTMIKAHDFQDTFPERSFSMLIKVSSKYTSLIERNMKGKK